MSSQSGSEYVNNQKPSKNKKAKVQEVVEKRSRRSARKNARLQQSQNPLPENIPITEGSQLIVFSSFELQTTKDIIQIPVTLFKSNKMTKQIEVRVGEISLCLRISNNQLGQIIVQAKIASQEQNKQQPSKQKKVYYKEQQNNKHSRKIQNEIQEIDLQEDDLEIIFLVWGKIYWIGNYEVNYKTIKQAPKNLNSQIFIQIVKIKTKDVSSDIFMVLSIKKKIQTVNDHNGLINQGNTCYMNSYLQMLSHISQFKNLVFEAPIEDENKFPATLQALFYKLDNEQKPVSAEQLVKSFGWTKKEVNIQQDAQQFSCLFYEVLQRKLQQALPSPQHKSMNELFEGNLINII